MGAMRSLGDGSLGKQPLERDHGNAQPRAEPEHGDFAASGRGVGTIFSETTPKRRHPKLRLSGTLSMPIAHPKMPNLLMFSIGWATRMPPR
jgi:hypothetical protein